jgi:hypothetical protein
MKLTSQLMKLDLIISAFSRKGDKLVITALGGKEGTLENIVTVSADEIIPMIGKIINRHVLLYVLFLPFFLIKKYLGEKDIQDRMFTFGLVISLLFSSYLLWMGKDYLVSYPLVAGITLFFFALFSFLSAYISCKKSFTYLGVFLLSFSYFCFVFKAVGSSALFPLSSIFLIFILTIGGGLLKERGTVKVEVEIGKKRKKKIEVREYNVFYPTLFNSAMLITFYFIFCILWNVGTFLDVYPFYAIIALIGFSLFYLYRYFTDKKVRWQYLMLLLIGLAYLLTLYTITSLAAPYYGLFLIVLGFLMMLTGDRLYPRLGIDQLGGFYVVGCFISIIAFIYSVLTFTSFVLALFFFSAGLFTINRLLEVKTPEKKSSKDPDPAEKGYAATFFSLANISAYLALFTILFQGFPVNSAVIISALGLSLCYLKVAYERKETFLKIRNYYIYPFGIFFAIFYFTGVAMADPFGHTALNMHLAIPLLLAVLYLSCVNAGKGFAPISDSLLDVSFFVILVAFILPFIAKEHIIFPLSLLAMIMGGIYLLFYPFLAKEEAGYCLPIVVSLLYYNFLYSMGVSLSLMGIFYVPLGVISVTVALTRYRKGASWFNPFYFATFFFSGVSLFISLYAFSPHKVVNIYNLIIWTAIYLIAAQLTRKKTIEEEAPAHA